MTDQDDISLGEIKRTLARLETNVQKLDDKMDAVQLKSAAVAGAISAIAFVLEMVNPFKRA